MIGMGKHRETCLFFLLSDPWESQYFIPTNVKGHGRENNRANCPSMTLLWLTQATRRRQDRELKTALWARAPPRSRALGPIAQGLQWKSGGGGGFLFPPGLKY